MRHLAFVGLLTSLGCVAPGEHPAPDSWTMSGPGGPGRAFGAEELFVSCAVLSGGDADHQEHNLVGMVDGYLLMPWAPEDSRGGVSLFDVSDPCAPTEVGRLEVPSMRETHTLAIGWVDGRRYLAVDTMDPDDHKSGGIGFIDLTDPTAPTWAGEVQLAEFSYPDAYFYVTLSAFWLGDVLYVPMGFHGVVMLDVSDPRQATEIGRLPADTLLSGSFHAIGNVGMLSNAGMSLTRMYDLSDPRSPMPIPGGEWHTTDPESGNPIPYYFANMGGRYALFARKGDGGGPMVVDISDPVQPRFVDHLHQPDAAGGYIFRHEDYLFQGEGDYGALYSFVEGEPIAELGRFALPGDLDTVTPVGNIAVVSVDHGAQDGISSVVVPWTEAVDDRGPRVELTFPRDEELYVAPTSAVGFVFDEAVNDASVFPGSVRVTDRRGRVISSRTYVQENIVNVVPDAPWEEAQTYTVTLPAGGVADVSGNALEADVTVVFSTDDRIR